MNYYWTIEDNFGVIVFCGEHKDYEEFCEANDIIPGQNMKQWPNYTLSFATEEAHQEFKKNGTITLPRKWNGNLFIYGI